jgi:hypothetical protein
MCKILKPLVPISKQPYMVGVKPVESRGFTFTGA